MIFLKTLKYLLIVLLLFTAACNSGTIFNKTVAIPQNNWNMDRIVRIPVPVHDSISPFAIYVKIKHNEMYRNANLWLFINTHSPNGYMQRDTLNCILADKTGKWYGNGFGNSWELEFPFKKGIRFPKTGTYTFEIEHGMRNKVITDISEIGLSIKKMGK